MRARVLVGEISRRSTGATRSGLIENSRPVTPLVAVVLAGLQFEQPVAVDVGAVAVGGGGGGDRAGDDLALHHEAFHPRVDQAGAELRQVENADDERDQARDVERDDAAGEAREALADEELPGAPRDAAQPAFAIDLRDAARQIGERVAPRHAAPGSSGRWRLGGLRLRGFGGSIEQWGRCLVCPSRALLAHYREGIARTAAERGRQSSLKR